MPDDSLEDIGAKLKTIQSWPAILARCGCRTYAEYLRSPRWKRIRARVFAVKGRKCVLCDAKATQIHHRSYNIRNMLGICIKGLVPICKKCHTLIEFNVNKKGKKTKVPRSVVNKRYNKLMTNRKRKPL